MKSPPGYILLVWNFSNYKKSNCKYKYLKTTIMNKISISDFQFSANQCLRKLTVFTAAILLVCMVSCSNDDDDDSENSDETFTAISSPYLICANRNPGGVGFDFEYEGKIGGANNMESLSVSDFEADIVVKTIKSDKDGTAAAINYITLSNGAEAINYSSMDATCKGYTMFQSLTYATAFANNITFSPDEASFSLTGLTTGTSGSPLMAEVNEQITKLIIGNQWLASAKNTIEEDELIWIIKTQENRWVKLIVTKFPAVTNAPTATGYIAIEWAFLN